MVIEMTRERRLYRALWFSMAMLLMCVIAFAFPPDSPGIKDVALIGNAIVWLAYNRNIGGQIELSRLDDNEVQQRRRRKTG